MLNSYLKQQSSFFFLTTVRQLQDAGGPLPLAVGVLVDDDETVVVVGGDPDEELLLLELELVDELEFDETTADIGLLLVALLVLLLLLWFC